MSGFQLYALFVTLWNHWSRTPYPILKGMYTRFIVHPKPRDQMLRVYLVPLYYDLLCL